MGLSNDDDIPTACGADVRMDAACHPAGASLWPRKTDGRAMVPPGWRVRAPLCPDGASAASRSGNAQVACVAPERFGGGDAQGLGTGPSRDYFSDFFVDALLPE